MGVVAEGTPMVSVISILSPFSLGYPLSVFNKNSTLEQTNKPRKAFREHTFKVEVLLQKCVLSHGTY